MRIITTLSSQISWKVNKFFFGTVLAIHCCPHQFFEGKTNRVGSLAEAPNLREAKSLHVGSNSQEIDDMMEAANDATRRIMEEQRRYEEAELAMADEIMNDFDV